MDIEATPEIARPLAALEEAEQLLVEAEEPPLSGEREGEHIVCPRTEEAADQGVRGALRDLSVRNEVCGHWSAVAVDGESLESSGPLCGWRIVHNETACGW